MKTRCGTRHVSCVCEHSAFGSISIYPSTCLCVCPSVCVCVCVCVCVSVSCVCLGVCPSSRPCARGVHCPETLLPVALHAILADPRCRRPSPLPKAPGPFCVERHCCDSVAAGPHASFEANADRARQETREDCDHRMLRSDVRRHLAPAMATQVWTRRVPKGIAGILSKILPVVRCMGGPCIVCTPSRADVERRRVH